MISIVAELNSSREVMLAQFHAWHFATAGRQRYQVRCRGLSRPNPDISEMTRMTRLGLRGALWMPCAKPLR